MCQPPLKVIIPINIVNIRNIFDTIKNLVKGFFGGGGGGGELVRV